MLSHENTASPSCSAAEMMFWIFMSEAQSGGTANKMTLHQISSLFSATSSETHTHCCEKVFLP